MFDVSEIETLKEFMFLSGVINIVCIKSMEKIDN